VALLGALGAAIVYNRTDAINTAEDTAGDKIKHANMSYTFSVRMCFSLFSHQILLESKELPTSWENIIIVKEFVKKFGEVTGDIKLCKAGDGPRASW